ncbi:hypothetical protein NQ314_009193 [Rhamnusium bicolor]|uniref:Uncharacterized protein n=1 Tax=Rhamnusium bicolor TaxID=1586634 RepID=A0AAV8Y2A9_9CUCU|nr:hypothetical protein NQ314_009193 [Rhamnusium bicolor]
MDTYGRSTKYDDEAIDAIYDYEDDELENDYVEINEESSDTEQEFEPEDDFSQRSRESVFVGKVKKTVRKKHVPP